MSFVYTLIIFFAILAFVSLIYSIYSFSNKVKSIKAKCPEFRSEIHLFSDSIESPAQRFYQLETELQAIGINNSSLDQSHAKTRLVENLQSLILKSRPQAGTINISDIDGFSSSRDALTCTSIEEFYLKYCENYPHTLEEADIEVRRHEPLTINYFQNIRRHYWENSGSSHRFSIAYHLSKIAMVELLYKTTITTYSFNVRALSKIQRHWYTFIVPNELAYLLIESWHWMNHHWLVIQASMLNQNNTKINQGTVVLALPKSKPLVAYYAHILRKHGYNELPQAIANDIQMHTK